MLSFDTKYRYGCVAERNCKEATFYSSTNAHGSWEQKQQTEERKQAKGNKIRLAREHGGPFGSRVTCETPGNDKNEPYVESRRAPPPALPTFPRLSFSATWKKVVRWLRPADELRALRRPRLLVIILDPDPTVRKRAGTRGRLIDRCKSNSRLSTSGIAFTSDIQFPYMPWLKRRKGGTICQIEGWSRW